jgi:hypothetical protein
LRLFIKDISDKVTNLYLMAKSRSNVITHGFSGKLGNQIVLKNYGSITVISKMPVFIKPWSEKQKECRRNFGMAAREAARLSKEPEIRERYIGKLKPRQSILNLVLKEKLLKEREE